MNERIRELAEQAKKHALDAMIKIADKEQALKVYSESYDTEFAELIVRECAYFANNHNEEVEGVTLGVGQALKKHFGVEDRAVPILSADEQALFAGIASSKLFTIEGAKKQFGVEE